MNYQAHRIGGICAGTVTATYAYQEILGNVSSWNVESFITFGIIMTGSIFGSLLPDIDHPSSRIGRRMPIISHAVNTAFGHRGFTHSILALLLLTYGLFLLTGVIPEFLTGYYLPFSFGLIIGYASHLLLDMITVSGIPLFYPFLNHPIRIARFRSGRDDFIVSLLLIALTGAYLYIFGIV